MTLYVMSSNKAGILLCAAARAPGPGKLAVELWKCSHSMWGAEPWQPQGLCSWCPQPRGRGQLMPEAAVDVARSPGKQESGTKQGLFPQP